MVVRVGGQQLRDRFNSEIISTNDDGRQKNGVMSLRCLQFVQPSGVTERPFGNPYSGSQRESSPSYVGEK